MVIVESPAKARTIGKFLGNEFTVEASIGHIRDLPQGAKEVPEEFKNEEWAYLGVNVDQDFTPIYVIPSDKKKQVTKLRAALKDAKDVYLATDEDREGEAISWHLCEVLRPKVPVHRLVFHEITEEAIREALQHPREIDQGLVKAQETRRILDRLYGYEVSPLLWRKIGPRLSAGRVQSVAVRLIVQRERERQAFVSASYWDLVAEFVTPEGHEFEATLISVGGRRIPAGKDFDPKTGQIKDPNLLVLSQQEAAQLASQLQTAAFRVTTLEDRPYTSRPSAPFTTSTMQQEANRKLGFTARKAMSLAQNLYENGYITYMRTDSTTLAQVAVEAARELVRSEYGPEFLPDAPRTYAAKVKNAQEAHEAIRPAGHPFRLPESVRGELDSDQFRLFEMIWKRTIASQMSDARGRRITIAVEGGEAVFQVSGKTIDFPGFLRAYVEGSDDPQAELADKEIAAAQSRTRPERRLQRFGGQRPRDPAAAALQRSGPDASVGRNGDRPPQHVRFDHRYDPGPRIRLQEGQCARPLVDGILRGAADGTAPRQPCGLRIHGADGGLSGRHQPARSPAPGLPSGVLPRQGPAGAEAVGAGQDQRSRRAGNEPVLAGPAGFGGAHRRGFRPRRQIRPVPGAGRPPRQHSPKHAAR